MPEGIFLPAPLLISSEAEKVGFELQFRPRAGATGGFGFQSLSWSLLFARVDGFCWTVEPGPMMT